MRPISNERQVRRYWACAFTLLYDAHFEAVRYQRSVMQTHMILGREEGLEEGRKKGLKKGIAERRKKGLKEWMKKGIEKGVEREKTEIAKSLLEDGLPIEKIGLMDKNNSNFSMFISSGQK